MAERARQLSVSSFSSLKSSSRCSAHVMPAGKRQAGRGRGQTCTGDYDGHRQPGQEGWLGRVADRSAGRGRPLGPPAGRPLDSVEKVLTAGARARAGRVVRWRHGTEHLGRGSC